jgi:hypothetical protein
MVNNFLDVGNWWPTKFFFVNPCWLDIWELQDTLQWWRQLESRMTNSLRGPTEFSSFFGRGVHRSCPHCLGEGPSELSSSISSITVDWPSGSYTARFDGGGSWIQEDHEGPLGLVLNNFRQPLLTGHLGAARHASMVEAAGIQDDHEKEFLIFSIICIPWDEIVFDFKVGSAWLWFTDYDT